MNNDPKFTEQDEKDQELRMQIRHSKIDTIAACICIAVFILIVIFGR